MIRFLRAVSLATIAMPLLPLAAQNPPAAAAQQPAACEIDIMQPSPLSIAYLQRQKVIGATKPEDALKAIRDAMKALSDDRNKSNALGRDYLLAQFYVFAAASNIATASAVLPHLVATTPAWASVTSPYFAVAPLTTSTAPHASAVSLDCVET